MKKTFLLTAITIASLMLNNLFFIAPTVPGNAAPPPPITPIPITTPIAPTGIGQGNPVPPIPGEMPAQVEQARARQAMEAALAKYLRYWGPRYQVAPVEVTVEGEWAHGVAKWQGQARMLSGPIHILAHRLPDGTWQALLPGTDGAYLQWLEAMPEHLVPAGEKSQLRTQAEEADALRRPQATPAALPPAVTATPSDKQGPSGITAEPSPKPVCSIAAAEVQPTVVSTPPKPEPEVIATSTIWYEDDEYKWMMAYPAEDWTVTVSLDNQPLAPYVIRRQTVFFGPLRARIIVDVWTSERGVPLREWIERYHNYVLAPDVELPSVTNAAVAGTTGFFVTSLPTFQSPAWLALVFRHDSEIYRLTYVASDWGSAYSIYRDMLATFRFIGESPGVTWLPDVPSEFVTAMRLQGDANCCGYSSPGNPYYCYNCGNCTWWAWYKRPDLPWFSGNASNWCNAARSANLPTGSTPSPGAIAVFENVNPPYGHVAYVEEVSGGSFRISEMWYPSGCDNQCCKVCSYRWYTSASCFIYRAGGSDTTDPDGDITSPSEGATISSRTVHLAGWAQDNAGGSGFNHAHFTAYYNGSWRQVGPDFTSSPFGFDWDMCNDGVPDGSVTIGLDIWDNAGNEANSPHGVRHFTKNYNCSPPPSCNPNADQVALYANTGYGGSCVTLGVGDYPNPGYLGSLGNDNAESIRVGSNVQALLYEHDNYQGRSETFTGDDSSLGDNYIGANSVSSVKVQWRAQPPAAPALQSPPNGAVFNEGQGINLSWSATGNEYYGEVWGGPGGTLTFGWQSGTSKDIGSQWAGYTYSWHVKARNGAGTSDWSSTWTFTVKPAAPSNLSAQTASCSQINLYWTDNSGNEEGYKIYRNGSYVGQVGMNATSYQDTGLNGNTSYSYYVRAFRGSIESDASNTVNITTPPCAPPQPDLRPYAPSGYPYPVVPSSVQGTHTVNTLYAGQTTYFDWHFTNSGNATASGDFHVELWVDGTRYVRYPYSDYGAGWSGGFDDWAETISTPGWHTVRLVTDPDNTVAESDENNNVWEMQFYWTPSAPYYDDMENGINDWTATGLWHQVDFIGPDGWRRWWYGQDSTNNYDTGMANSGDLTSPPIYIPDTNYYLRFLYYYQTETQGPDWDQRWVQISVDGGPFNNILQLYDDPMQWWLHSQAIDLSGYAGHVIRVRFHFDTIDNAYNAYHGWYIDNFEISATPPPPCADTHEPNNTPTQATAIAYGQALSADICPGGDYDFYQFTGSAGDKIVIDIDTTNESWLDSYVFLLDSNGNVLAANDDEIWGEIRDSHLGYQLPHDGTYYIKMKAWNHPSAGGSEYFYTIHLLNDNTNPSATITWPGNDTWMNPVTQTITVVASDNDEVNRVEFLWHDADWENSEWVWLGADNDGRDGWSWDFSTSSLPEQRGGAFYIWAFDWVGNWTGAGSWNLGIDRTPPTASTSVSPMYGDAPFRDFHVWWYADDNLSGTAAYDVQYRDGAGGAWTNLVTGTTDTYYRFVGQNGHTYYFRTRAYDYAGNIGNYSDETSYTVQICPVAADSYEADNTSAYAHSIETDGTWQMHNFHVERDQDWVKFIALPGITYTLATTNTGGHADTVLYLYDRDGITLLDSNDDDPDNWPASRLNWQAPTAGTYYIKVEHWDPYAYGCTTGYGLSITPDRPIYRSYLPVILRNR